MASNLPMRFFSFELKLFSAAKQTTARLILFSVSFVTSKRPFASCPEPLFQSEAKCNKAVDMKMILILTQIKPIVIRRPRKVSQVASF